MSAVSVGRLGQAGPLPCGPPPQPLTGRVVAVTEYPEGRCRAMARAAYSTPSGGGAFEAEFIAGAGLMPGWRVEMGKPGVAGQLGPLWHTWPVLCWAHNTSVFAPMRDDSGVPPETRTWVRERARQLGLVGDIVRREDKDGTRVWVAKLETGRGATEHIKMPGESWREVCDALGLGWPAHSGGDA